MPAKRKRSTRKGQVRKTARRAYKKNPVARRAKRRNPKAGLSANEIKDLGTAAIGGAASGALTAYLEGAKPKFLEKVPTEVVSAAAGLALAMFGKTPAMKNISRGMVSYAAGRLTERVVANAPAAAPSPVSSLVYANPGHYGSIGYDYDTTEDLHVGGLVFSMED
jgi:hypothetical protein|tara:strand:- start:199 stop:693 length:495 start_codon:yes stop_codon:yes gene_type:complete